VAVVFAFLAVKSEYMHCNAFLS